MDYGDVAMPMNVVGVYNKTGKLLCTFALELGDGSGGGSSALALRVVSAHCGTGAWDTSTAGA